MIINDEDAKKIFHSLMNFGISIERKSFEDATEDDFRIMERDFRREKMTDHEKFMDDEGFAFGPDGSFYERETV